MIPINLVFPNDVWSSIRNLKLRYLISDLKILTKIRVGSYATNTQLILVDLIDDEDLRPQTDPPTLTMRDLKERKIITHPIVIILSSIITFILHYTGLAIELNITISHFIISDHRLPSFCQLDVQEASKLTFKFTSLFEGKEIF